MDTNCQNIPHQQTGFFSKMVLDYLQNDEKIRPFYQHEVNLQGIKAAIEARNNATNHRQVLYDALKLQYKNAGIELNMLQQQNISLLLQENTYTITTAHQPNIFTGHLYFIYKILHTVKLAAELNVQIPGNNFIPVFYMGSEDADLEELGHVYMDGEKLTWNTKQTGAVGRMLVDNELVCLINKMAGRLEVLPFGKQIIEHFRNAYQPGKSIQLATLHLVNTFFKEWGLLILVPDSALLKRPFNNIIKKELLERFSHPLVEETGAKLNMHYKVQASGRELNLFYLINDKRERIEFENDHFEVRSLQLKFTKDEILAELDLHPERFSPNVILRGVFQETILPNIAFIGGGGEIAYWLELKSVFETCNVPFPVIILRNSFLLIQQKHEDKLHNLGFNIFQSFNSTQSLINDLVCNHSQNQLTLNQERIELLAIYEKVKVVAAAVDASLNDHVSALQVKLEKSISSIEKKILKAEKKKFESQSAQISKLKSQLFPNNNLQERIDNIADYYALYGDNIFTAILATSSALSSQFCIVTLPSTH